MNEDNTSGDIEAVTPAAIEEVIDDPIKQELDKVKKQERYSEAEKAAYALKKNAERVRELGGDPNMILGFDPSPRSPEDDTPVTVGMLKKIEAEKAQKTSIQLAEEIADENVRELTKHYLQTRIVPSGDPKEDYKIALAAVNSIKNQQIAEEVTRQNSYTRSHESSAGAPAKVGQVFEPTPEEAFFMNAIKGLTPDKILEARKRAEKQG